MDQPESAQENKLITHEAAERKKAQRVFLGTAVLAVIAYLAYAGFKEFQLNRAVAIRIDGKKDLEEIRAAAGDYYNTYQHFPHGTSAKEGEGISWQASLLPYLGHASLYNQIHPEQKWDTDRNLPVAQTAIDEYLNEGVPTIKDRGFALSHYAANSHIVGAPNPLMNEEITDGRARTILAFEVPNSFLPWMDPANVRDPTAGIGSGPGQIGREGNFGCQVLFMSGSVRFLSENIDPAVLKAMATYDGNDVDEFDELDASTQELLDLTSEILE